jgi:hypothetical protein
LGQILVVGPNADFLHPFILRGEVRRRREPVVGFQLDHGPDRDAHRGERFLQGMELRPKRGLDAVSRLVVGPQLVAERFDDMIGGDAEVGGPLLDHLQHRMQHAGDGPERFVLALVVAALTVELTEQLVGAVQ